MEDWKEAIDQLSNNRKLYTIEESDSIHAQVKRFDIFRDKNKNIVIDVVYDGWVKERKDHPPVGTFNSRNGKIVFRNKISGSAAVAGGVIHRNSHSSSESGSMETTERFTAHTIHLEADESNSENYCVEHIDNLSTSFVWPHMIDTEENISSMTVLNWEQDSLSIPSRTRRAGGARVAMHLNLEGYDLIICADDRKDRQRTGKIVYLGVPDTSIRDKVRDVISFAFGRPIVYYGFTVYSHEWRCLRSVSVEAYSINGMMFQLHALPPYPVFRENMRNFLDVTIMQTVCSSILNRYDQLDFQKSSWAYWHAMCAPYHMEAAHFGALVERVQDAVVKEFLPKDERNLFTADAWKQFRPKIIDLINSTDIKEENKVRLTQAVDGIGRVSQPVIMASLFQRLDVPLGHVETNAWKQRNRAAHGIMKDDHIGILLNNKVLRLIFHRLIAGITKCSSRYVDYYNINFPIRHLRDPLPERTSR